MAPITERFGLVKTEKPCTVQSAQFVTSRGLEKSDELCKQAKTIS